MIRPGGRLHFLEHGASPEARIRKWQDRLTPIQKRVADGCNLNKEVLHLIERAGFEIQWSDAEQGRQPKVGTYFVTGVATNP